MPKMLIGNHYGFGLGGTQRWEEAMTKYFSNYEIDKFYILPETTFDRSKEYDVALINHNTTLKEILKGNRIKKIIFTSHGVKPDLEQPIAGADKYVAVSEEVQENLKIKGFESVVIRNPIDCDEFRPVKPINEKLKYILYISNYQEDRTFKIIKEACRGYHFTVIGKNMPVNNMSEWINNADLIIGLGRSCLEAMACGRNVVVYDHWGGDGFVTPETMLEFRKNNCSGRRYAYDYTPEQLRAEIEKYNPEQGIRNRQYVLENNSLEIIGKQYAAITF
jgi:glycosyltransferase involved in cell wall biosynthesis